MHVNTKLTHVTLSYTWHLHANVVVTKTIVTCRGLAVKDCGELPACRAIERLLLIVPLICTFSVLECSSCLRSVSNVNVCVCVYCCLMPV